jgi:predicted small metal-binding protein
MNDRVRARLAKQVTCDCGFMLRTPSDDELVKHVQLHAKDTHSLDLTPEQALARAVSVEATIQA